MLSLIAAMSRNRVIGQNNELPWHLPADLKHFRNQTRGKPVIMGRKTYDSIGRPLPKRRNLVVSRQSDLKIEGCECFGSVEAAIAAANEAPEVMIIGGATIYEQTLPLADRLYITLVDTEINGDAFFPPWDEASWSITEKNLLEKDEDNPYSCTFLTLDRVK